MTTNIITDTLHTRAVGAAVKFLGLKHWRNIERVDCAPFDLIARDGETLVFVHVEAATEGEFPAEPTRADYERGMVAYMIENPGIIEPDVSVRVDTVTMALVGNDRALLRHHVNAVRCDL